MGKNKEMQALMHYICTGKKSMQKIRKLYHIFGQITQHTHIQTQSSTNACIQLTPVLTRAFFHSYRDTIMAHTQVKDRTDQLMTEHTNWTTDREGIKGSATQI